MTSLYFQTEKQPFDFQIMLNRNTQYLNLNSSADITT